MRIASSSSVFALLVVGLCSSAAGQQGTSHKTGDSFGRSFVRDEYYLWTSPFRPANYKSHTTRKYGAPFLVISAGLIATDRRTADLLPNTLDQTRWSGRVSQLGASYSLAGFAGTTYLLGRVRGDDHLREAGSLGLQALAHSQIVTRGIKGITQRRRPPEADERRGFWKGGTSFPSGHAASSFAVATVFAYEYRHHIAVPITSYALATAISASRMSARRHWVSDIFVGSSLGFLIGRYVYKAHHDPSLPGSRVERQSRLVPEIGLQEHGLALTWTF